MVKGWIEQVTGSFEQKKQYKNYKARSAELPDNYRTAIEAFDRYLMYFGSISKGDVLVTMLEDLLDMFEQAAADETPIRSLVGENPVEFIEDFLTNYSEGQWISKERNRLIRSIDSAAGDNS